MSGGGLSQRQRRVFEAAAELIIPEDGFPGARQAGILDFLDWVLRQREGRETARVLGAGLDFLDAMCNARGGFLESGSEGREEALRRIERLPHGQRFFELLLRITLAGFLGHPRYGGNRDFVGWRSVGFRPRRWRMPPRREEEARED